MCLFLASAVLCLGIIQWSFLPILVQSELAGSRPILELSAGHTAKFAAPYKCLFGGGLRPCLAESKMTVPRITSKMLCLPEAPISGQDDFSLSHRSLRAPPSA
jgi:hypothetical protein